MNIPAHRGLDAFFKKIKYAGGGEFQYESDIRVATSLI